MIDPKGFNELKLCRSGPMLYNKNDWPIGLSMQRYGEFSWQEVELFRQLVGKECLAVDVGANIGTHTVEFSKMAAFVVAFEPQRVAFQTLCANLALNQCTNVQAFQRAIGKEDRLTLVPIRNQYMRNNFGGVQLADVPDGETVEMIRLDKIHFHRCDFIKADIEGMEAEFLIGAQETIATHRPVIYIEADGAQKEAALWMLFDLQYECYWHFPRLYNDDNFAKDPDNVFLSDAGVEMMSVNALCVPFERHMLIDMPRIQSPAENGLVVENRRITKQLKEAMLV